MFGRNTTLEAKNDYDAGYNEAVDDVFIAFSEMLDKVKDDNTYHLLMRYYTDLSNQFPQKTDAYEE